MGKTWTIHPKHRKKGSINLARKHKCSNCNIRKVSRFHHVLCNKCWNEEKL